MILSLVPVGASYKRGGVVPRWQLSQMRKEYTYEVGSDRQLLTSLLIPRF